LEQGSEAEYKGDHKHLIPVDQYKATPEKTLKQVIQEHTEKFLIGAEIIEKASDVKPEPDVFTELKRFTETKEEPVKVIKKKGK
jgi:hypothetical protein